MFWVFPFRIAKSPTAERPSQPRLPHWQLPPSHQTLEAKNINKKFFQNLRVAFIIKFASRFRNEKWSKRMQKCNLFLRNLCNVTYITYFGKISTQNKLWHWHPPHWWIFQTAFERRFNKIIFQLKDQPLKYK